MKKAEKDELLSIFVQMNDKRIFTDKSIFELNILVTDAILIIEKIDKNSDCFKNLKEAENISEEFHKLSYNQVNQNTTNEYAMKIIQLSQYPIKEFAEKY